MAGADWLTSTTGSAAVGTGTSCPDKTGGVIVLGAKVSVVAAVGTGLTTEGVGEGTGAGTAATDTGNAGTGTGAGVARLVSGAGSTSLETETSSRASELARDRRRDSSEEGAAEVTTRTGCPALLSSLPKSVAAPD